MVSVRINGSDSSINTNVPKICDLIELIKATIDPEHMITGILINGRELEEHEWQATTSQFGSCILEIETGKPDDYVSQRLAQAADIVRSCYILFRDARKKFQQGDMVNGNKKLLEAVNTFQAFFEWYGTLIQLVPPQSRERYDISKNINEITEICKRICQQQLYQSWWALGETLEKELEPKLDLLEDKCSKFATQT